MNVSKKVSGIAPSLTLEITAKAKKMKAEGISVIGFGAGEPDFNTPQYIIDSAKKALDTGFTKYTPAAGTPELKKAICEKFLKDNGLTYEPNQIVVSSGAKSSLYHAICALVDEGDDVILPSPYWLTYPELVKLAGGNCIYVQTKRENGFKITAEELKQAVTPKTKCLILNSPNNPTGAIYTEKEIKEIAKVVEEAGIWVISDEIYEKLVYEGEKHYSIASVNEYLKEHTVIVNGMSKTYAMTGWRLGYLAAPLDVAKAVSSMQSHTTSNACSITQYASTTALTDAEGDKFIEKMQKVFDERRKLMIEELSDVEGIVCIKPLGAFYVFIDVSGLYGKTFEGTVINGSLSFADCALKKGVALIPGIAFGDDNCIRLSYAISIEDIKEGLSRLKAFIKELK
ncbi:MAG: pyridoxal phosphate-dependent aminotransferase [Clostridiales bacterium]|nr:pyridoxal phosphate-dependent aminotransferase [Clostridiales bacterium]